MGFHPQENATNHQTDKADVIKLKSERTNERARVCVLLGCTLDGSCCDVSHFNCSVFHSCLPRFSTDIAATAAVAVAVTAAV